MDHKSRKGYWNLSFDSETEEPTCSTMLETLKKLQEEVPKLFPAPPKIQKINKFCNLLVFTSDDSEEGVRSSAEAIRSNVDHPFVIYYFKISAPYSKDKILYFRHTPDGGFYEYTNRDNSAGASWKLITGKNTESTALLDELLPSQVTDKDFIHLPVNKEDFQNVTNEEGGKWIVHCSDWETLDNLWKNLIRLYHTGVLVGLKSSTSKFSITKISPEYNTKAIMCYTADADCKSSVKKAAQSIFICTGYSYDLYYKSNKSSLDGHYRHEGFKGVSKYMYTRRGEMLEKDSLGRWKKIIFEEGKNK